MVDDEESDKTNDFSVVIFRGIKLGSPRFIGLPKM